MISDGLQISSDHSHTSVLCALRRDDFDNSTDVEKVHGKWQALHGFTLKPSAVILE